MTTRLKSAFSPGRKLLCPFLTAGYPSLPATPGLLLAAQRGGAGVLELGIPFSDPVADGPVIQASFTHALAHGSSVQGAIQAVAAARTAGLTIPVLAMVSFSIIFRKNTRDFARFCVQNGVDGVILPDIPLEEAPKIVETLQNEGLETSLLIAPTTAPARRAAIANLCSAFVYYLSVSGITGERQNLPSDMLANVAELRKVTQTPICVGFGISTPQHVRQVVQIADGAIVGSALVRRVTAHLASEQQVMEQAVEDFVRDLARGLPGPDR